MPLSNLHGFTIKNNKRKLTKLVLFFLTIVIILLTSVGVKHYLDGRSKASFNIPQNINVSNLSTAGFSITWLTPNRKTSTFIMLGTSPDNLNQTFNDKRDSSGATQSRNTHIVEVKNLSPNTIYYYRILVNNDTYPSKDQPPFKVKTLPVKSQTLNTPTRIYGQIDTDPKDTIIGAYVIQNDTECVPVFDIPNSEGNWYIDISNCIDKKLLEPIRLTQDFKVKVILESSNGTAILNTSSDRLESPISLQAQSAIIDLTLTGPSLIKIEKSANSTLVNSNTDTKISPSPTPAINSNDNYNSTPTATPTTINPTPYIISSNTPTPTPTSNPQTNVDSTHSIVASNSNYNLTEPYQLPPPVLNHIKTNNQEVELELIKNQTLIPSNIQQPIIGNITENSFSVIWYTENKQPTNLYYGITTANTLIHDDRDTNDKHLNYLFHKVTLKHLKPNQGYTLTVNNQTFEFTTPKTLNIPPSFVNVSGRITNTQGECFLKFQLMNANKSKYSHYVINAVGPNSYSWNINLGSLRNYDLTDYWDLNSDTDILLIDIFCSTGGSNINTKHLEKQVSDAINDNLVIDMQ